VIILPPDAEVGISLGGKVLVKGRVRVRLLPGFLGPAGWVPPLVQVVVESDSVRP
jgi:hypothetical protein